MSLFDRMKEKLESAGKGAQKLTRVGQLKLELMSAETKVEETYKALGKACAQRLLDQRETSVEATDTALAHYLDAIKAARLRVAQIQEEIESLRGP